MIAEGLTLGETVFDLNVLALAMIKPRNGVHSLGGPVVVSMELRRWEQRSSKSNGLLEETREEMHHAAHSHGDERHDHDEHDVVANDGLIRFHIGTSTDMEGAIRGASNKRTRRKGPRTRKHTRCPIETAERFQKTTRHEPDPTRRIAARPDLILYASLDRSKIGNFRASQSTKLGRSHRERPYFASEEAGRQSSTSALRDWGPTEDWEPEGWPVTVAGIVRLHRVPQHRQCPIDRPQVVPGDAARVCHPRLGFVSLAVRPSPTAVRGRAIRPRKGLERRSPRAQFPQ